MSKSLANDLLGIVEKCSTNYERVCLDCGNVWLSIYCPHATYQQACEFCGTEPKRNPGNVECMCEGVTDQTELMIQLTSFIVRREHKVFNHAFNLGKKAAKPDEATQKNQP